MAHIGKRIQMFRKRLKVGQDVIADACGITRQAVSRWERGLQDPDEAKLPAIAAALGVDVLDLTGMVVYPGEDVSSGLPSEYAEYSKYTLVHCATLMTFVKLDDNWQALTFDNLDTGEPIDAAKVYGVLLVKKDLFKKEPYAIKVDCPSQLSAIPLRSTVLVDCGAAVSTGAIALLAIEGSVQFARVYPSDACILVENDNGRRLFRRDDSRLEIIGPAVEVRIAARNI